MKTRIMFYLVLVVLFVFSGNSFVMGEAEKPSEIGASKKYDEIIGTQGVEGNRNTLYGNLVGTGGLDNCIFGANAGEHNTGNSNSFFGRHAGSNSTGDNNSFFGRESGNSNTSGHSNSFFGRSAGNSNTTGIYNSFFGLSAGYSNTTGYFNSFFGLNAGYSNTTGRHNSFFGLNAGYSNVSGSGNVFLGTNAGNCDPTDKSNQLFIDNFNTSTPLIWGDFNTNNVVIYGNFRAIASSSSSDGRWKKNIRPLELSLDKIANLKGVSYEWKIDEYPDFGLMEGKQIGLVAQDVEKEIPELVSEDKDGYKAVSYTKLTAVLVEAVKELKIENENQKKLIGEQRNQFTKQQAMFEKQQTEIEELRSMIRELKS